MNINERKGLWTLLHTIPAIPKDLHLYIKFNAFSSSYKKAKEIKKQYERNNIHIIIDYLTDQEIESFYATCDFIFLPTRGEGFCFPAVDSMKYGTIPIIPRHTALLDYITRDNSVIINSRARKVRKDEQIAGLYKNCYLHFSTAEEAAQAISIARTIYDKPDKYKKISSRAQADIQKYNIDSIRKKAKKLLHSIF
jgi:glycogen synthase